MRAAIQTMWTKSANIDPDFPYTEESTVTLNETLACEQFYRDNIECLGGGFYGSGSIFGQMGRWKACAEANAYCLEKYDTTLVSSQDLYEYISENILCTKENPIPKIEKSEEMNFLQISDALQNLGYKGLEINKDAGDGPIYSQQSEDFPDGLKKGDTILADMGVALTFMEDLAPGSCQDMINLLKRNAKMTENQEELIEIIKKTVSCNKDEVIYISNYLNNRAKNSNLDNYLDMKNSNGDEDKLFFFHTKDESKNKTYKFDFMNSAGSFWTKWGYLMLAKMKPKADYYHRGEDNPKNKSRKTRNYWESNFAVHLPFVIIVNWLLSNKPNPVINEKCHSLTGWSPVSGGIHGLLVRISAKRKLRNSTENKYRNGECIDYFIFCDNIFLAIETITKKIKNGVEKEIRDWTWISLDGVKMEAASKNNLFISS